MIESIAMVEDNGGFSGVIPTAHELGHLYVNYFCSKILFACFEVQFKF